VINAERKRPSFFLSSFENEKTEFTYLAYLEILLRLCFLAFCRVSTAGSDTNVIFQQGGDGDGEKATAKVGSPQNRR
jgi:hypothetical protein